MTAQISKEPDRTMPGTASVEGENDIVIFDNDDFTSSEAAPEDHNLQRFEKECDDADREYKTISAKYKGDELRAALQAYLSSKKAMDWHGKAHYGRNFLHHLAYINHRRVNLRWLMSTAFSRLKDLIGDFDHSKRTPLTVALCEKNEAFIESFLRTAELQPQKKLAEKLANECLEQSSNRENPTCLHTALATAFSNEAQQKEIIKKLCRLVPKSMFTVCDIRHCTPLHLAVESDKFRDTQLDIIKTICSFMPPEGFTMTDNNGRTPLHIAVEYDRCSKNQVDIVKELILQGPAALQVEIRSYEGRSLSMYQYHENSRKQSEARKSARQKGRQKIRQEDRQEDRQKTSDPSAEQNRREVQLIADAKKTAAGKGKGMVMGPPKVAKDSSDFVSSGITRRDSAMHSDAPRGSELVRAGLPEGGFSAAFGQHITTPAPKSDRTTKEAEQEEAAGRIGKEIKLRFLRRLPPDYVSDSLSLYDGKDKQLWFDFCPRVPGIQKKFKMKDFKKHFNHMEFDSVLQYVAFPQVQLLDQKAEERVHNQHQGRKDMVKLFNWLKEKNVENIIKVTVDDLQAIPHSDDAIEESLDGLNVEILDWRRHDLSPVSLAKVGASLREVHLHWSGRDTVLRSWSEKEGLPKIPTLEEIHLYQTEGWESIERTKSNLCFFENRLRENWPHTGYPQVFGPIYDYVQPAVNQTSSQDSRPPKRSVDPHKWIQCMDRFAESFKNIKCVRDGVKDSSLSPVRVALIDDGTDITHSELNIQLPGKSFETCQEGPVSRVVPYWESASGHGTLMARLIRRVCPSAEILVIKLNVSTSEGSDKFQINVDSAIKAIEYAASRNVHIISMSWTTKQPTDTEKQRAFEAAMYTAISKKGILVFCAASDQGKAPDMTYPANANNDCFRIGAAEATGAVRATVGDTHRLSYIFPGHNVSMDSGDGTEKEVEGHSGSSVATALAAGLAALIIECVRLGIVYTNMSATPLKGDDDIDITTDDLTKIRQRNVMKQAFLGIGVSQNTNNKYIEVWDMFSQPAERLKRVNDSYGHLGIIAGLARLLLRKGGQNIAA